MTNQAGTIHSSTVWAATRQQRLTQWIAGRPVLVDAALLGGAAVLEVILELHDASMPWPPTLLAVRIPVIIAVVALRRRWPLSMLVLAVADVVLQSEVSAALPIAAYALTRYRTQWSVRIPAIAGATVGAIIAASDTWGHTPGSSSASRSCSGRPPLGRMCRPARSW